MSLIKEIIYSICLITFISCNNEKEPLDVIQYVDPFIGAAENGHCFPGATSPLGLVQPSPVTGNCSWDYCSSYQFKDSLLFGFSQTHLNGTGCTDLGDILLFPFTGDEANKDFVSVMDKESEKAYPGFYEVFLLSEKIHAELTATDRVAHYRFTYQKESQPKLLIDFQHGSVTDSAAVHNRVLEFKSNIESNFQISGYIRTKHWVERTVFFVIEFNKPFVRKKQLDKIKENELAERYVFDFDLADDKQLLMKISLSSVSIKGAKNNLNTESDHWDFDKTKSKTCSEWNRLLGKMEVIGSLEQKTNLYTSLYHLYIQPNNIADVDGSYRAIDDEIHQSPDSAFFSTLSLWDTYRAAHPFYTIFTPQLAGKFISSMIQHQQIQGFLPIWSLWGKENYCMIGNHAVPVITDAYLKGISGFDEKEAYEAIKQSLTKEHYRSEWGIYDKYGYLPCDIIQSESVSRTLESLYDDYCAGIFARKLGYDEDARFFENRSNFYKNLFDPETRLMRGKNSDSTWRKDFDPLANSHYGSIGGDYTEANAWQYVWHVQHDIPGLIDLMGGDSIFINQLDSLFLMKKEAVGHVLDVTGLIGQYAHGNEPSHHVAYLYRLAGKPRRTEEVIRNIIDNQYKNYPEGLCGNDDCGQMSAWLIFSSMGFYPVNPCGGKYILGAPQVPSIKLNLENGKVFNVKALNISDKNKYVKQVTLNGEVLDKNYINHDDIMRGGEIIFIMSDNPTEI